MEKGFSLTETIISMTLSLFILFFTSLFVDFVRKESFKGKEEMEDLQEIYSGIDRLGYEIKRCGIGLSLSWENNDFKILSISEDSISLRRGNGKSLLKERVFKGEKRIIVEEPFLFKEGREVIITNKIRFERNKILKIEKDEIRLSDGLENEYPEGAEVIQINFISFKYDSGKKVLRMSQNSGPYQPFIEGIENCTFKKDGKTIILNFLLGKKSFTFKFFIPFGGVF